MLRVKSDQEATLLLKDDRPSPMLLLLFMYYENFTATAPPLCNDDGGGYDRNTPHSQGKVARKKMCSEFVELLLITEQAC